MKVQLIVVQGKPEGKTIPLTGPLFRIGRTEGCHLRPNSELVSREHAEIAVGPDGVVVRDLGSRNGTLVNGKPLPPRTDHPLKNGELLQVGPLTFAVSIQGAPAAVAAPARVGAAAGAGKGGSLDDVPPDAIDSWLVADQANPTPERPSGVYDGDTLTINAYREAIAAGKPPSSQAQPAATSQPAQAPPTPAPATPAPAPAAPTPAPAAKAPEPRKEDAARGHYLDGLEFDQLPEGEGDAETAEAETTGGAGGEGEGEGMPEEMFDESNPFYAAKKAATVEAGPSSKNQFKDSSDAASEILRRMMDRRRPH